VIRSGTRSQCSSLSNGDTWSNLVFQTNVVTKLQTKIQRYGQWRYKITNKYDRNDALPASDVTVKKVREIPTRVREIWCMRNEINACWVTAVEMPHWRHRDGVGAYNRRNLAPVWRHWQRSPARSARALIYCCSPNAGLWRTAAGTRDDK